MNAKRALLTGLLLLMAIADADAGVMRTMYQIDPGGHYTYKPSPEGSGIPGGAPNAYELDFGIAGTFVYELDLANSTARFHDLNLTLTGNESIQANPPTLTQVTADRVADYLAGQQFVEDFIGGLLHLKSSTSDDLKLTDGLNGNIMLHGGFDATPADGVGLLFNFSAIALPGLPGDTNADGVVDLTDLNNVRNHFGGSGLGDANGDGSVDLQDLNLVRNYFGADATVSGGTVPEPATWHLALLTMAIVLSMRARRYCSAGRFIGGDASAA